MAAASFELPFHLVCHGCGAEYDPGPLWFGCAKCRDNAGHPHWLEVTYDWSRIDLSCLQRAGRLWDYAPLLPARHPDQVRTLGEGGTPLLCIEALNREIGLPNLFLKLETVNPTGAFKDRLHSVALTVAREKGYARGVVSSTGNSGVAAAAFAALNGIALVVILDPAAPPAHRRLMHLFGARVTLPGAGGPGQESAREMKDTLVRERGFYPCTMMGTFAGPGNPYGVEGYKTIAFEIRAQLGRTPDRMCVPASGGAALYGPFKGFRELRELGLTDSLPRMTACQSEGANFAVQAMRRGLDYVPVVSPDTFAISIGDPTGSESILTAIRETGGDAWEASDAEILEAMALLGRNGICVEGASAAPIAALRRHVREGGVNRDECVVALLTATGMKWMPQVERASGPLPPLLAPDSETIPREI